ncbi:MAG: hypothetical protein IPL78_09060 [Chloroflexi bacterium]|nr:hypothetical protein [Chloroflexota bacterium]
MSCFQFPTSSVEWLFYALSFFQAFRAVQLAQILWHERADFQQEPLTRRKAGLGEQAAFFLAIPPSVAVHEFFHALPIWAFGGRIIRCGYGFYWGFVQADIFFPAEEQWVISLAGTIGSLLFGLALWLVLRRHTSSSVRFFALRSLRIQLFYSLIFYPIFSAVSFIGDWRIIYNFERTPMLSGGLLVVHGVALGAMWYGQREGWFEMRQADSATELAQIRQLEAAAAANPQDMTAQLHYIRALRQSGTGNQAKLAAQKFIQTYPDIGEGYVELALVQLINQSRVPRTALDNLRRALSLPISHAEYVITAHLILGQHDMQLERPEEAMNHFSYAIEVAHNIPARPNPNY